ncbi:hypothetical protein EV360DRAFT_73478, partial [Lentinula raphanica]
EAGEFSDCDGKIPKPVGEVGRPGRGGYNLRIQLQWQDDRFERVKKFINKAVDEKMDGTKPLSEQPQSSIKEVQEMALRKEALECDAETARQDAMDARRRAERAEKRERDKQKEERDKRKDVPHK